MIRFPVKMIGSLKDYVTVGSLLVLLLSGLRYLWYSACRDAIFSRHTVDSPTLEEIQDRLRVINVESRQLSFAAIRRANILFREHLVTLVFGQVGGYEFSKGGVTWRSNKTVFAISDRASAAWLLANPEVFKEAFLGTQFSIFWVSLSKVDAGSKFGMQAKGGI